MLTAPPSSRIFAASLGEQTLYVVFFGALHATLGLAFGDLRQFIYFTTLIGLAMALRLAEARFRESVAGTLGVVLLLGGLVMCVLLLPTGAPTAAMLVPYAASAQLCFKDWRWSLAMFVPGLLGVVLLPYLGLATEICDAVPELVSYGATFFATLAFALISVEYARKRSERKELEFVALTTQLTAESDGLAKLQHELQVTNAKVAEANASLRTQLDRETNVTEQLSERRVDEEELVRAIHHDLREPLRSIVSFNQLIGRSIDGEPDATEAARYLAFAKEGGLRMVRMLDDLLAYTSGGNESVEEVDLGLLLDEISLDLHHLFVQSGARIELGELPVVLGYRTQLVQLCQNLLANAIKFARPGVPSVVKIAGKSDEHPERDGYCVTFADNGIGIPADKLEHVFGLFNRAHEQDNHEGGGVGLALCRRIAIAHGARLRVASVEGEGTSFSLSLPSQSVIGSSRRVAAPVGRASAKQDEVC